MKPVAWAPIYMYDTCDEPRFSSGLKTSKSISNIRGAKPESQIRIFEEGMRDGRGNFRARKGDHLCPLPADSLDTYAAQNQ